MKKIILAFSAFVLITGVYSCTKTDTNKTALCNNGIKDGGETEIDCGASCTPCPAEATLTCTLGNTPYESSATKGYILGPSIRIYAQNSYQGQTRPLMFMFQPTAVNQPLPITAVSFAYNGEAYIMEAGDSGRATITAIDTVRKIISGSFWFLANRTTGPDTTSAREGVFANVRYNH